MKWFAIYGAIAVAALTGQASAQAGPAPAIKGMSYPSASFGRILPARLLNAIRIGGNPAAAEQEEIITSKLRTCRIVHIIGNELE